MQGPRSAAAIGLIAVATFSLSLALGPQPRARIRPVSYRLIAPIIAKNCVGCHRGAHPKHGLDLTSYAMVVKGDTEGKVVIAGKPADSRLSKAIHRKGATPMPPPKALAPGDVAKIDAWIKAGARP